MNYQIAAIVGGVAFLLSALAGLIGGVPIFDLLLRGVFWGLVGFGGCLGVEVVLKSLMPDLFTPGETGVDGDEPDRKVDIVLDDEAPRSVFEEVDDDTETIVQGVAPRSPGPEGVSAPVEAAPERTGASVPVPEAPADEEMPEIGAFLDAFKPAGAAEGQGEAEAQEFGDQAPRDSGSRRSGQVSLDGEEQDPVILAKAIQTVMKRDGQGT